MREIINDRVTKLLTGFQVMCRCGSLNSFTTKSAALNSVYRDNCRACNERPKVTAAYKAGLHMNTQGKWCSTCSSCGGEQAYTRMEHARQSSVANWKCRKCVIKDKGFSNNSPVGPMARAYNKFKKLAANRGIPWLVTLDDVSVAYTGYCTLTGWELSMKCSKRTASLDRIDSSKPYEKSNIQWVHSMVNMSKNKYKQIDFVKMCRAVASNFSTTKESY
jgi:hypothetical protein